MLSSYQFVDISSYGVPATQKNARQRAGGEDELRLCAVDYADPYEVVRERMDLIRAFNGDLQTLGDSLLPDRFGKPFANRTLGRETRTGTSTILKQQNVWTCAYGMLDDFAWWKGEAAAPLVDASAPSVGAKWWTTLWPGAWHLVDDEYYDETVEGERTSMLGGIPNEPGSMSFGVGCAALSTGVLERIYSAVDKLDLPAVEFGSVYVKAGASFGSRTIYADEQIGVVHSESDFIDDYWQNASACVKFDKDFSRWTGRINGAVAVVLFESSAYSSSTIVGRMFHGVAYDVSLSGSEFAFPAGTFERANVERFSIPHPSGGSSSVTVRAVLLIPDVSWRTSLK